MNNPDPGGAPRARARMAIVCLLAAAPFLPKLWNGLLQWDDERFITRWNLIHSMRHFTQFFRRDMDGLYRPLRTALYAVSYDLLGFADRPLGYQIVGLALHATCAGLFFLVARRLLHSETAAFAAGALFAVHPIHVERVAWVTASYDLLSDALLLAALAAFWRPEPSGEGAPRRPSWAWTGWLLPALFAAETAVVFPLLAAAGEFTGLSKKRDRLRLCLTAFGLVGFYLTCRWAVTGSLARGAGRPVAGLLNNVLAVASACFRYLELFALPWRVNYFQVIDLDHLTRQWTAWAALAVLAGILAAALWLRTRRPAFAFGALWFFICLLPASQIAPNVNLCQERYAYLAFGGFALAVGAAFEGLWRRAPAGWAQGALAAAGALCVAALTVATWSYTSAFHDDLSLWTRVVGHAPRHAGAHNNLGAALLRRGKPDEALQEFRRARELDPAFSLPLKNIAVCLRILGRRDDAVAAYERYLQVAPGDLDAAADFYRLGVELGESRQVIDAIEGHLAHGGAPPDFLLILAQAQQREGNPEKAREALELYRQSAPETAEYRALKRELDAGGAAPR
jgi:tetratricopeptide (TPR) repeat protein